MPASSLLVNKVALHAFLDANKWSASDLATKSGVSVGSSTNGLKVGRLSSRILQSMATALGTSVDAFTTSEMNKFVKAFRTALAEYHRVIDPAAIQGSYNLPDL